jgi:hypothetical protein
LLAAAVVALRTPNARTQDVPPAEPAAEADARLGNRPLPMA